MVLMKQLRMYTIPWIGVDKATICKEHPPNLEITLGQRNAGESSAKRTLEPIVRCTPMLK